ncbi:MAG: restriction endonuclease [Candidatus Nitrotoga sp.]
MEDILERVGCPSTSLIKCQRPPISEGEITALIHNIQDEPTFRGVWTLADDGCPVAILHALDEKNFRAARTSMTGVLAWNWPTRFGKFLSFSLVMPREHSPRIFVPDDCALARAVFERGRITFAVSHGKQLSPFYLADFTKHPEHPDMLEAFRAALCFENDEHFLFRDDEIAFWLIMHDPKSHWNVDLSLQDSMRARWAYNYVSVIKTLNLEMLDVRARGLLNDAYANDDARANAPVVMPFFDAVMRIIISPSTTTEDAIKMVSSAMHDPGKMGDLVSGIFTSFKKEVLVDPLKWVLRELLWTSLWSPTVTQSGLRRPWLDGRNESGDVAVRYIDLDPIALGEDARWYWAGFEFHEVFDIGNVITGKDVPIPRLPLYQQLADLKLECTEAEASDAISELLAEARENRQWSAPWGARVQIDVGSLKYLDIYEIEGEFIALFRDLHERFMMIPVNVSTGNYSPPFILKAEENFEDKDKIEENTQAALALVLIVASVVRDFLVVEDRQSHFVARPAKRPRCTTNKALSIIYLPRVRYLRPDIGAFNKTLAGDTHHAAHDVNPHLRKAEKASAAQMLLAMRYGFSVPRGYTFVRPHRRGEAVAHERQRLYRSRSASAILYRALAKAPFGSRPAWFDFEKDVATVLSQMGLRVVHQAASRNGDGGVDIYAHDETEDIVWAIQCKCYASARKVGPDVVRELAGSLHRYPEGTCGMIVTTSSFTPGAIEEAVALNIKTIDGSQFIALGNGTITREIRR